LEAQRAAVKTYLNGGDWQIVDEYTEVESGKRSDRPALDKALAAARLHRASPSYRVCLRLASMSASRTFRRLRVLLAGFCCSRWSPLPSSKPA
jgi:DNA invertase Pin-like site-specific DNA recombinase